MTGRFAFDRFVLDVGERRLTDDGAPVELNSRYLDALTLLVRCQGQLVSKDRFLGEVWRGIPVTDEALTQCIKALRRLLGDEAGRPKFIETVPKHGYRFIAPVDAEGGGVARGDFTAGQWPSFIRTAAAGTAGGAIAGLVGGLAYGLAGASDRAQPGEGALSVLLVLLAVTFVVALIGGAGVSLGIAAGRFARPRSWTWAVAGGAAGGFFVGAFGKLLGLDAFNLLVGQSPGNITGGTEGLVVGAAVGLAANIARLAGSVQRGALAAGACGAAAGLAISLAGGRLMLGSLALLTQHVANSRLRLDEIASLFGEPGLGPLTLGVSAALETALFAACIAGAMRLAERKG